MRAFFVFLAVLGGQVALQTEPAAAIFTFSLAEGGGEPVLDSAATQFRSHG